MFSGLIEKIGKIENIDLNNLGARLSYSCDFINPETIKTGDSIALNGVCLTVTSIKNNIYTSDVMKETLDCTNLKELKKGDSVNLERAMSVNSRFDGHIVSGHIDTVAKVKNITNDGFSKRIEFICDNELIILKGSICVNGISLTVSKVFENGFEVSLIPTTIQNTNLNTVKIGDSVNIEYDIIGKYVKKFIKKEADSKISIDFLKENGFY